MCIEILKCPLYLFFFLYISSCSVESKYDCWRSLRFVPAVVSGQISVWIFIRLICRCFCFFLITWKVEGCRRAVGLSSYPVSKNNSLRWFSFSRQTNRLFWCKNGIVRYRPGKQWNGRTYTYIYIEKRKSAAGLVWRFILKSSIL